MEMDIVSTLRLSVGIFQVNLGQLVPCSFIPSLVLVENLSRQMAPVLHGFETVPAMH